MAVSFSPSSAAARTGRKSLDSMELIAGAELGVVGVREKPLSAAPGSLGLRTFYRVQVSRGRERTWSSEKRYSDFLKLHSEAKRRGVFARRPGYSFPAKKWLGHSDGVKEGRRRSFDELLGILGEDEASDLLLAFLAGSEEAVSLGLGEARPPREGRARSMPSTTCTVVGCSPAGLSRALPGLAGPARRGGGPRTAAAAGFVAVLLLAAAWGASLASWRDQVYRRQAHLVRQVEELSMEAHGGRSEWPPNSSATVG